MDNRILELAIKGLEAERARIDEEITELSSQLNGRRPAAASGGEIARRLVRKKRSGLTAAGRKTLSESMRARWAAKANAAESSKSSTKPKLRARGGTDTGTPGSRLTPAGRKILSDMMKKRWAERRKAVAAKK